MSYINQLVKNKGETNEPCLEVVGDLNGMKALATLWDQYADLIHIVGINGLIDWTGKSKFTSEQSEAFQEGLAVLPEFMEKCLKELKEREH